MLCDSGSGSGSGSGSLGGKSMQLLEQWPGGH